ncbi:MAG TPA: DUF4296 domain-containing protein [Cyclobacteriaceae bacterium]|jgi:hypothetical protein|nr:DUF4296 domain-containing protein [Cyclobacteriaceae bacterium]
MRGLPCILIVVGLVSALPMGLTSCHNKEKKAGILSRDEMVKVMTDIYVAEHKVTRLALKPDSSKIVFNKIKDRVFNQSGVPDSVFRKSFDYYVDRPLELEEIYTALVDSLNLKEQQTNVSLAQPVDKK